MKINTKFWLALIIISTIVIVLKNFNLKQSKRYIFQRSYQNNTTLKIESQQRFEKNTFLAINDSLICTYKFSDSLNIFVIYNKSFEKMIKRFDFSNLNFKQISSFNENSVLFIDKFRLYNYSVNKKNISKYNTLENLKVFSSLILDKRASNILLLAELKNKNSYETGFFIFNTKNSKITTSRIIEVNDKSAKIKNTLIYSGKFNKHNNITSYMCDKTSDIFFFDKNGGYLKKINTKDSTPKPKTVSSDIGVFYDRGNTYNTNNGILKEYDNIYIFSSRTKDTNNIVIDIYSYDTGKYVNSIKFYYKNKTSVDINIVSIIDDNIFIFFDNEWIKLKMIKKTSI